MKVANVVVMVFLTLGIFWVFGIHTSNSVNADEPKNNEAPVVTVGPFTIEMLPRQLFRSGIDIIVATPKPGQAIFGVSPATQEEARAYVQGKPKDRWTDPVYTYLEGERLDPIMARMIRGQEFLPKGVSFDTEYFDISSLQSIVEQQKGIQDGRLIQIAPGLTIPAGSPAHVNMKDNAAKTQETDLDSIAKGIQSISQQTQELLERVNTEGVTDAFGNYVIAPGTQQQAADGTFTGAAIAPASVAESTPSPIDIVTLPAPEETQSDAALQEEAGEDTATSATAQSLNENAPAALKESDEPMDTAPAGSPSDSLSSLVVVHDTNEEVSQGVASVSNVQAPSPATQVQGGSASNNDTASVAADTQEIEQLVEQIKLAVQQSQQQGSMILGVVSGESKYPYERIPDTFEGFHTTNLWYGMDHEYVQWMEIILNADPDTRVAQQSPGSPGNETTYFDQDMLKAVCRFQEKHTQEVLSPWGLTECTGFVGPTTRAKLNQLLDKARENRDKLVPRFEGGTISQAPPPGYPLFLDQDAGVWCTSWEGYTCARSFVVDPTGMVGIGGGTGKLTRTAIKDYLKRILADPKATLLATRQGIQELGAIVQTFPTWGKITGPTLSKVVRDKGDLLRLAKYVDETREPGIELIERAGKQIGVRAGGFQTPQLLQRHFNEHAADTGLPWLGRAFTTKEEYLQAAKEVLPSPNSKKVLYYNPDLNHPTLGYLLEKEGNVFLAAVNDAGNIKTFLHLDGGWSRVIESTSFQKLFKIDPF